MALDVFYKWPLEMLYMYGYWGSAAREDLCGQLTGYDAKFWAANEEDCNRIIDRKIDQITTLVACMMYFYFVFSTIWRGWNRLLSKLFSH